MRPHILLNSGNKKNKKNLSCRRVKVENRVTYINMLCLRSDNAGNKRVS